MADRAGELAFGRYRLLRSIGRGGMGEVYLGHDDALDRPVAIKFVSPDKAGDPDARRRLLREAQTAAGLDHPCICMVYETGETADGRAFIVMQYIEGESLAQVLRRGPLPVRETLVLGLQIAEALAVAHARGVVHRDLKPGNVILSASGRPKLVDFGLAKRVFLPAGGAEGPTLSGATGSGGVVGTAAYMSPEQVQQRPVDKRSDLFALGVLLFECLTGRRGFEGPTPFETAANIVHRPLPAPTSLRRELTDRHDELCWRLTAKAPADRFQSADEVVGAIRVLLGDASSQSSAPPLSHRPWSFPARLRGQWRMLALSAGLVLLMVFALAGPDRLWTRARALPSPPPEADRWYRDGMSAIREGSYMRARRNLERAVAIFPEHALAHARLAEANAELDDQRGAQQDLLRVSVLVPNESWLPPVERLRLAGVRALVLRDVDRCVDIYRELADRHPDDAGAWLDLGRVQEAAGLRTDARTSYRHAIEQDSQYAAAYLRLAYVEGLDFRREEALEAFGRAERLYRAASDVEGETEVLLRRGIMHDAFLELKSARADLERAHALAAASQTEYQRLRASLALSSVAAAEGDFAGAERTAVAAVDEALAAGLETIAADGLIELAAALLQAGRADEAEAHLTRAIALADVRGAARAAARARVQLAAVHEAAGRTSQALADVEAVLPSLRDQRYRRFEFSALLIAARAHERLDALGQARQAAADLLTLAETLADEGQIASALSTLAAASTALGEYPEALRLRERSEAIVRRLGDKATLPFHLGNRAELLILLGRASDADRVLAEIEVGIAEGIESYVGRQPRAAYLRALSAATSLRCEEAVRLVRSLPPPASPSDGAGILAADLARFCQSKLRAHSSAVVTGLIPSAPGVARQRQYWMAAAALEQQNLTAALDEVDRGLELLGPAAHDSLRLPLAAIGAIAARQSGDTARYAELSALAGTARERMRRSWGSHDVDAFTRRPDVAHWLERAAGG